MCRSSKSAPNTLTRPHMDQSVNMYSQRTPQPLARGPINYTLYGEDSNSSLMSSAFGEIIIIIITTTIITIISAIITLCMMKIAISV